VSVDSTERLSVSTVDGADATLVVTGDLDAYTVGELEVQMRRLGVDSDVRIDLSGVTFMDSSGIRAVVRLDNALREQGHELVLVAPSAPVLRLFELTSLVDRFRIDPSAP
jgi:anti-anti-sigma factor